MTEDKFKCDRCQAVLPDEFLTLNGDFMRTDCIKCASGENWPWVLADIRNRYTAALKDARMTTEPEGR